MVAGEVEVEVAAVTQPSVLVVNDSESQRLAMNAVLAPLRLNIVEADSGRNALRAVLAQRFALILMDVRMPTMDGYETARLIRQRAASSRTPIIFVTAFAREDTETLTAYATGAVDFIFTPIVPEVVRAKVSVFVDLFVQSEELRRSLAALRDSEANLLVQSTELQHSLAALHDSEASTRAVLDNVADGIVTVGEQGLIEAVNRSARNLFGHVEERVIGQPLACIIAPSHREEFRRLATDHPSLLAEGQAADRTIETLGCREDGSTFPMEVEHGEMILGERTLTLAFVRDITERNTYIEALEHQALHDDLTGLANRALFGEHIHQALALAQRMDELRAVLVMDLDGFKQVNDVLGHDHGDVLLKQFSERLSSVLRDTDMIARIGGDEFGIMPGGATDLASAAEVAHKIHAACETGFEINNRVLNISASIGIAMFPDHGSTPADLLRRADAAMYVAKRTGSGHAICDVAEQSHQAGQLALLSDLRHCIARNELVLHYQPKIDLSDGTIFGVEALIRWRHPQHGLLMPASFMPQVERTELIEPVTRWVLNEALRQQRAWREEGIDLSMAVNVSARSLGPDSTLPDIVAELTTVWGTAPGRLTLELTEGALVEATARDVMTRLHDMGERMSIDDFGTGYSSLAYLQRLPADEIKIDRSFLQRLAPDSDGAVIVRATIELAHNLNLSVVAEGVEEPAAMELLVAYGCDSAQGYLFSRPCPADELTTWIGQSRYGTRHPAKGDTDGGDPRALPRIGQPNPPGANRPGVGSRRILRA